MKKQQLWTEREFAQLKRLVESQQFYLTEIAAIMKRSPRSVAHYSWRMGLKARAKKKVHYNTKYSVELRKQVHKYFKNHTRYETAKKFGLTDGEITGLLETSRRMGLLPAQFKDKRRKDPWTGKELQYLFQRAGILPRKVISRKLKRGSDSIVKWRLKNLRTGTKWMNGMCRTWAQELWGAEAVDRHAIKTKAGPGGVSNRHDFYYVLIPWPTCEKLASKHPTPEHVKSGIRAMSKFQKWIHQVNSPQGVTRKVRSILNEK